MIYFSVNYLTRGDQIEIESTEGSAHPVSYLWYLLVKAIPRLWRGEITAITIERRLP